LSVCVCHARAAGGSEGHTALPDRWVDRRDYAARLADIDASREVLQRCLLEFRASVDVDRARTDTGQRGGFAIVGCGGLA
jgi:hypothetical protein